jgi:pimeloyl-ACP methyl ester carboxylesterase
MRITCIHGNSSSGKIFRPIEARFEHCHILELPGHGNNKYSKHPEFDYSVKGLKAFVKDRLPSEDDFIILGHSLGGHLALELAPDLTHCKGLALFGTPPIKSPLNLEEAFLPCEAFNVFLSGDYDEQLLEKSLNQLIYDKSILEILMKDFKETDPQFRPNWIDSAIQRVEISDEALIVENLKIPLYVIHGKQDPIINLDYIKSLKGITKIYEIDECGHYPSIEQPVKFGEIIREIKEEITASD